MRMEVFPIPVSMFPPTRSRCDLCAKGRRRPNAERQGADVDLLVWGFRLVYKAISWKSNALQQNMARKIIVVV